MTAVDWATWLVEGAGHAAVEKKSAAGIEALTPAEHLIYCLWVADYGMRNAGDLEAAHDLYPAFQSEGERLARELALPRTVAAFASSIPSFEQDYFEWFDAICLEVSKAAGQPVNT